MIKNTPLDRATPRTNAAMERCGKLPTVEHMYGYMVEHAAGLERELRIAQCPLHDCCGGVGKCAYYD